MSEPWEVDPKNYEGITHEGVHFSGRFIDYGISDGLNEVLNEWEFYVGNHPDGKGDILLRCNECHSSLVPTKEGKALHLIQSHEYRMDGRKRVIE